MKAVTLSLLLAGTQGIKQHQTKSAKKSVIEFDLKQVTYSPDRDIAQAELSDDLAMSLSQMVSIDTRN
jgi:hypothetical protein